MFAKYKSIPLRSVTLAFALLALQATLHAQQQVNEVVVVGQMKDVMWKGELAGKLQLDSLASIEQLYGLGPVEYLSGEIFINNGKVLHCTVLSETSMTVVEAKQLRAPFFAYAQIPRWREQLLPDSIGSLAELEKFLLTISASFRQPFMFRIIGPVKDARIHVVNLPKGTPVSSPNDAHQGQVSYTIKQQEVEILGFFSTQHKSIFTHHDSFVHMHLLTADQAKMGHLDQVSFTKGQMKLLLPAD